VDTNIWLDAYRSTSDAGLSLLKQLEDIKDEVIVTFQVEIEFQKNRQSVIEESMNALRAPTKIAPPRLFSDAKKAKSCSIILRTLRST
jgi:hypothetical protein